MTNNKYKHSLIIMRAQPFHIGHSRIIQQMLNESDNVTILLGSIQEHGTKSNPINYSIRKKMILNIYKNSPDYEKIRIIGIHDINNHTEWAEFVLDFVGDAEVDKPKADAYFAGSEYDASWFKPLVENIVIINRADTSHPFVSATMIREMLTYGDTRWKDFTHPENHKAIEDIFYKRNKGE